MNGSRFEYVTYIRISPERLWAALTKGDEIKSYFFGVNFDTDWKPGSPWRMFLPDGRLCNSGEIRDVRLHSKLTMTWRHEMNQHQERKDEGDSLVSYQIEAVGEASKLTLTQTIDAADSKMIASGSDFWPQILSNLKSVLETGRTAL